MFIFLISCETYNTTETDSCGNKYSDFDLEQICYEGIIYNV